MFLSSALSAAAVKSLPNGLRYVIVEDESAPVVSMQVWVRCGGVDEEGPRSGVSHFLEHMIFKGTDQMSANEISKIVESNGGSINAATGGETTHYHIDIPSDRWEPAFDALARSVLYPAFPHEEFEKERQVILEEIKRRNDDPQSDMWDGFLEALYTHTPYRNRVIGSADSIRAMTRDILVDQHRLYYVPGNMVVVVVGHAPRKAVHRRIVEHFGSIPRGPTPPRPALVEPPAERTDIRRIERTAQQAHVAVGFVGPTLTDPDQVTMDVLAVALGGGRSSRLYQKLREEQRRVWSISASFITHAGSGALGIFAECPPDKARSLPNDIYFVFSDLQFNGFTPEEVDRARAQLRSAWLFNQETYHGQASQWGYFTALGYPRMVTDYLKRLDRVRADDLKEALSTHTLGRQPAGVMVLPSPAPSR